MTSLDFRGLGIGAALWFAVSLGFTACSGGAEGGVAEPQTTQTTPDAGAPADEEDGPPPTLGSVSVTPVSCTKAMDCAQECTNSVSNFGYECVSPTQIGFGFNNRCAWLTVSSKLTPPGVKVTTLYNDTTRKGMAYQPCIN